MAAMHAKGAVGFLCGINPEQNLDRLMPVGTVALGVEKTQIELHVSSVIARESHALRRLIHERIVCQIETRGPTRLRVNELLTLCGLTQSAKGGA